MGICAGGMGLPWECWRGGEAAIGGLLEWGLLRVLLPPCLLVLDWDLGCFYCPVTWEPDASPLSGLKATALWCIPCPSKFWGPHTFPVQ